jgi:hypothetical protein
VKRVAGLVLAACAASVLALAGCVTVVEEPKRGVQVKKSSGAAKPGTQDSRTTTGATRGTGALEAPVAAMQLPDGQIAQPVTSGVSTSRVQVAVAPIGMIEYDGQTLPIVSPDGRFIAVQQGKAPTWATMLAQDDQTPADGARLAMYEVIDQPNGQGLKSLAVASDLPAGLVLGRDASPRGFLVESVRPDGSRWIGEIAWATGQLTWLVTGTDVFAHAANMPGGAGIVCSARERGGERSVVLLTQGESRRVIANEEGVAWLFPIPDARGEVVFAMCVSRAGVEAGAIGVRETGGSVLARRRVATEASVELAYQAVASMQPSAWAVGDGVVPRADAVAESGAEASIAIVHPDHARVVVFEPRAGTMLAIGKGTVASIRWREGDASGYFVTGREGLLYLPDAGVRSGQQPARVLGSPFVVRAVRDARGASMIGFGPSRGNERMLEVLRIAVGR